MTPHELPLTELLNELPGIREQCIAVVEWYLVFDSQRAVSWHEIQDCIEAIRREVPESTPAELGRKGGLKGGKALASKLTKEQRSESARNAAKARWANRSKSS